MGIKMKFASQEFDTVIAELKKGIEGIVNDIKEKEVLLTAVSNVEESTREIVACIDKKMVDNDELSQETEQPKTAAEEELSEFGQIIFRLKDGLAGAEKREALALKRVQVAETEITNKRLELATLQEKVVVKEHQSQVAGKITKEVEQLAQAAAGLVEPSTASRIEDVMTQFKRNIQIIRDKGGEQDKEIMEKQRSQQDKELIEKSIAAVKKLKTAIREIDASLEKLVTPVVNKIIEIKSRLDREISRNVNLNVKIGNIRVGVRNETYIQEMLREYGDQKVILEDIIGKAQQRADIVLIKALSAEAAVAAKDLELTMLQEAIATTEREAAEQQSQTAEQAEKAAEQQLKTAEQQLETAEQQLKTAKQDEKTARQELETVKGAAARAERCANAIQAQAKETDLSVNFERSIRGGGLTPEMTQRLKQANEQAEQAQKQLVQAREQMQQVQEKVEQAQWPEVMQRAQNTVEQATEAMQKAKEDSLKARNEKRQRLSEMQKATANEGKVHAEVEQAMSRAERAVNEAKEAMGKVNVKAADGVVELADAKQEAPDSQQGREPEEAANNKQRFFGTASKVLGVLMITGGSVAFTYMHMREGISSIGNFFTCYAHNNNLSYSAPTCWYEDIGKTTVATAAVILFTAAYMIKCYSKKLDHHVLVENGPTADSYEGMVR